MAQTTRNTVAQFAKLDKIEFGVKQESTYGAALATADITKRWAPQADGINVQRLITFEGNDDEVRGVEWPDAQYEVKRDLKIEGLPFRLSAETAAYFAALCLGKITSVDNTDYQTHTIVPNDRTEAQAAGKADYNSLMSTSLRYSDGPGQNIAAGIVCPKLSIEGRMKEFPTLTVDLVGSGEVSDDANSFQSVESVNLLQLKKVQIGVAGSEEDISSALESLTIEWDNDLRDDDSWYPGSGLYRGQALLGVRKPSLSLAFKQHSTDTELTNFLANTALKAIVTFEGDTIGGGQNYDMVWTFYQVRYAGRTSAVSAPYKTQEMAFHIEQDDSDNFVSVVVDNDVASYFAVAT